MNRAASNPSKQEPPRETARAALRVMTEARQAIDAAIESGSELHWITDLGRYDPAAVDFLLHTLGKGEVHITLCGGEAQVQETEVPSLWLLTIGPQLSLVAALLPRYVDALIRGGEAKLSEPEHKPEGLFAAAPVLSEISHALAEADLEIIPDAPCHQVDLSRQPLTPADMNYILATIGEGKIDIELSGYAKARLQSSRVKGLWRDRIFNKGGRVLMDSLVVALIPPEVPASREDLPLASERLRELIEWIDNDLRRGVIS